MTTSSKQTFANPESQISYWKHQNICFHALKNEPVGLTFREVAAKVRLPQDCCWKRLSELNRDGKIKIIGTKLFDGRQNSIYVINREPELFEVKHVTLRQWLKIEAPMLLEKYDVLILHKL